MRFQLTDYQTDATGDVISALSEAFARFEKSRKLSAISLSAPTGAGKTVIATAVIERMLHGSENSPPRSATTVLWVTDDPSLNVQTKRKMLLSSSLLRASQLVTVDQTLDQRTLDHGKVYFVHIQQLGKGATKYIRVGNKRQFSLWETIGNTIAERGDQFILVVDEAHRGTSQRAGGSKTITAQLIDGAGGTFPPAPVVLGLSATPQRFADAISRVGNRTLEPVAVDPQAVRESGLLKDKVRIKHPIAKQPGDSTLLRLSVEDLKEYDALWKAYSLEQQEPLVRPALVVQVRPKISDKEISALLDILRETWGELEGKAIGHSFQEHSSLNIGSRSVRYVAPQDIQDDPHLRVVLFKEALTTGWDCPRAEVMISLRPAQDHTYIAQLIGRMVRTPLARRIATDDVLNSVSLYLPYFDADHVATVVSGLQSDESQIAADIEVNGVTCPKNAAVPKGVWDVLASLPTFTRPAKHHRNDVSRLNALATILVGSKIDDDAIASARKHLVGTMARESVRLKQALAKSISELERIDYETLELDLRSGVEQRINAVANLDAKNIEDLFRQAKRTFGDAAAKWYWDALCDQGLDPDDAKLHVAALAREQSVPIALESAAKTLIDTWRNAHNGEISCLPDAKRAQFYQIWQQAKAPELVSLILPHQITTSSFKDQYDKHLYASKGKFPVKLTGWEEDVLKIELGKKSLVGWYRNPTSGGAALAVPYVQSGTNRTMYPDFVFFHKVGAKVVIDIVDPHRPNEADAGPKWVGLARYAVDVGRNTRRVAAVIKDAGGRLVSLDLKNPDVLTALQKASTETDIRGVFDKYGGNY